ncbi:MULTISPECIES: ATP-grasp domain-containing protein [unclassified Streptomyces]|uniref:ATP-grasp domain-containing protein n=1 Tax=Streptomyces TaxID=1883 RepID=UPI00037480F0|nr:MULTISPECIES: ATP-grasp domain-containing protein [unclassified Streptomyces]MCW7985016.1 l-amino acid ligase [Streptomyces platensis subsp. clarensis]MYT10949.1 ATP-grasp domain-containing protein [Streptomyces sp. SID4951]MYX06029.1 ATP-grasp domain-containing protein [Streptomyces sp. SID8375]AWN31498.1 ATP-grasp domain-containing protein [Streptomyces sp. NEAU-S7GS2]SCK05528.1 L-amino acid ligase [Streptomyces sp. SceaMP-e96]
MSKVLFVYAKGGPPLGYALSRVAARSAVHLLALSALPPTVAASADRLCASVLRPAESERHDLVSLIVSRAQAVGADAVVTFSEYAVVAVAEACEKLGLAGAGGSCALARDKRMMRRTWQERGISQPRFRPVATERDLHDAAAALRFPLLLKAAWSAGSTAHRILRSADDVPAAWERAREVMAESAQLGYAELHVADAGADFIVEEIVPGTATEWFDQEGWGDYVSVEGVVVNGDFRPVCLSGRMPTVEPFTERAGITPAALPHDAQQRVVALAREAVDALGLQNCGTHTEIKLGAGGQMWVIETAARFGGAMTVPQIEEVFGLDLIGMLTDHLLGRQVSWPAEVRTPQEAHGAAGSLVVLAVDGAGEAWPDQRVWDFPTVRDAVPLSAGSHLSVVAENSLPDGTPVPVYDPAAGANTMAALCLLSATDPETVIRDFRTLVEALPQILPTAGVTTEVRS